MKVLLIVVAGFILPLSEANAGNWLVIGDIGRAMGDTSAEILNRQISSQGLNASASSSEDNRTAWKLLLGYQYTSEWVVEIGYVDLGEINTKLTGNTSDINTFLNSVSDIHPQTAHGIQLSASYHYPLETTASVFFRAGLFDWESKYKLETSSASHTVSGDGTGGIIGIGFEKDITLNTKLNVSYNWYDVDDETISYLGMGLTYSLK